ncbi:putative uncharacterized protein C8orf89 homolog isoform X3 [Rhineura floridana]|uniref:putative uncharacterized protein C8orf89 homolog isoform X3 n=1 Tax=Rhineura floridana TaxID=261503 RepID=UPI002AC82409|nr:putative uncharacterized protein C8orf89 homolog isoform X3 [Rhineura floridana]
MSRSQQRNRLEQRDLQVHDGKLPEISCIPECRPIASQPPKGQKLPILKSDQRLLGNKVSGKSFESRLFENSWKNAVIKTKRMKQVMMIPVCHIYMCFHLLHLNVFLKVSTKADIAMGDIKKRVACTWKTGPLKTSEMHGGAGELGAVRLKKYNRCSSLISFPEGSKFKTGYRFTDPVSGAPPQYLQRLSELAALECETIHQEKSRKIRRTKKQEM